MARLGGARDRIEDRPLFYHERVRAGYLAAANVQAGISGDAGENSSVYPAPIVLIDASADSDTVFNRIQHAVLEVVKERG
jgi:dTMP kinase